MENYLAQTGNNANTPKQRETSAKPFFFFMSQNQKERLIDIGRTHIPIPMASINTCGINVKSKGLDLLTCIHGVQKKLEKLLVMDHERYNQVLTKIQNNFQQKKSSKEYQDKKRTKEEAKEQINNERCTGSKQTSFD